MNNEYKLVQLYTKHRCITFHFRKCHMREQTRAKFDEYFVTPEERDKMKDKQIQLLRLNSAVPHTKTL